jgi:hypothetical protein
MGARLHPWDMLSDSFSEKNFFSFEKQGIASTEWRENEG